MSSRFVTTLLAVSIFSFMLGMNAWADNEFYEFETAAQERQFNTLAGELRCPKCQNQTIADSDAPLAQDMRERVYQMIMEGKSNAEIIDFMKVRYGDFVHYRPPINKSTLILWLAPLAVIIIGALAVWFNVRHQRSASAELTPEEEARMDEMFAKTDKAEERDK
ncbi:cystathionine gamma-synthase [Aliidiomarina shirensis]|uniref:Cytochrome c-type biogenesis protein n=1 Tax=Aliidiomarina shirensis TaxID=1048642 RepID=A0A432WUE9_9GAMM|nr:cytochrome c-type biogenesis protein [Aliidiomarina shirensis]RUO37379.1 cystathionine gamma-synthase [Aliidiomarina shirensis]